MIVSLIWGHREAIYFRVQGWTGFRKGSVICPSGSHTTHHIANERRCEYAKQRTSDAGLAKCKVRYEALLSASAARMLSSRSRHGAPDRNNQKMPLKTRWSLTLGTPRGLLGKNSLIAVH
jgi:hypothetical protein